MCNKQMLSRGCVCSSLSSQLLCVGARVCRQARADAAAFKWQYLSAVHELLLIVCQHAGERQQGRGVTGCSHKCALQQALPACAEMKWQ